MIQGRSVTAEIEAPDVVEVYKNRKTVGIVVRVSLHNTGESDFVAHARNRHDELHWHVVDGESREVQRRPDKGKDGDRSATESRGVHSYRTLRVPAGHSTHTNQKLILEADKLEPGNIYTIRGETFGHVGETSFAVVEGRRRSPAKKKARKRPAKKRAKKSAKKATKKPTKKVARKPARKVAKKSAPAKKRAKKTAR